MGPNPYEQLSREICEKRIAFVGHIIRMLGGAERVCQHQWRAAPWPITGESVTAHIVTHSGVTVPIIEGLDGLTYRIKAGDVTINESHTCECFTLIIRTPDTEGE